MKHSAVSVPLWPFHQFNSSNAIHAHLCDLNFHCSRIQANAITRNSNQIYYVHMILDLCPCIGWQYMLWCESVRRKQNPYGSSKSIFVSFEFVQWFDSRIRCPLNHRDSSLYAVCVLFISFSVVSFSFSFDLWNASFFGSARVENQQVWSEIES